MEDDEISCLVPPVAPGGRPGNATYCHMLIEMMKLSSLPKKRLSSARALRQSAEQLVETVRELSHGLDELRKFLLVDTLLDLSTLPEGINLRQALSIQYNYFCLIMDIHTPLATPWSVPFSSAKEGTAVSSRVEVSCAAVAQASRDAILTSRQIRVDAACPSL